MDVKLLDCFQQESGTESEESQEMGGEKRDCEISENNCEGVDESFEWV
jgi:hypothetical protein